MSKDDRRVIKKIYKKAAHGHHGGAWKIAYADFVTAMMSFFLIMWLINSLSLEQKKGIADYFTPNMTKIRSKPAGEGVLAGQNATGEGLTDMTGSLNDEENNTDNQKQANANSDKMNNEENTGGKKSDKSDSKKDDEVPEDDSQKMKALIDVQDQIKKAIESNMALRSMGSQIQFEITAEGLNINIVDKEDRSMFPPGSTEMYDYTRNLLSEVASTIRTTKNKIGISSHTDQVPFANTKNYTNWEVSADRANATRRVLESSGIVMDRVEYVKGRESKELLNKANPSAPENRRITITLLK